jgi:mannose-1-phosphate guanylyltransferase
VDGEQRNLWVVILAGGDGRRLSSLTANADGVSTPKQYWSLNGGPSLLQLSQRRALGLVPRTRIVTVVTEAHRRWWEPELSPLGRLKVVVQPSNRGTGIGVLLPLLVIAKSDPEASVICLPSDHYVEHEDLLAEFLRQATAPETLDGDKLTLLGMFPNAPDSGFGYLFSPDSGIGMRPVHRFIEEPDRNIATALIRAGGVWSSGIVAGRISQIIDLYPQHTQDLVLELKAIVERWPTSRVPTAELALWYQSHAALDFSRDVLQQHPQRLQFLTVPACGWADVGTPTRLVATLASQRSSHGHYPTSPTTPYTLNLATAVERAAL